MDRLPFCLNAHCIKVLRLSRKSPTTDNTGSLPAFTHPSFAFLRSFRAAYSEFFLFPNATLALAAKINQYRGSHTKKTVVAIFCLPLPSPFHPWEADQGATSLGLPVPLASVGHHWILIMTEAGWQGERNQGMSTLLAVVCIAGGGFLQDGLPPP